MIFALYSSENPSTASTATQISSSIVRTSSSASPLGSSATGTSVSEPQFTFNESEALQFYQELNVPSIGLLQTFPQSNIIYLADDQALDYFALRTIFNSTQSAVAISEAREINNSISSWGGLYQYWNPVFVVVGDYPSNWVWENGVDQEISSLSSNSRNYTIRATVFSPNLNFDYYNYADQELYYSLWNLHLGNYSAAESAFSAANSFWNGYGFADKAFNSSDHFYTSYKMALALIAWKSLEQNPKTTGFATSYISEITNITSIMSLLQGSDGGVWTNYAISEGNVIANSSISQENGETTSLFVLAYGL